MLFRSTMTMAKEKTSASLLCIPCSFKISGAVQRTVCSYSSKTLSALKCSGLGGYRSKGPDEGEGEGIGCVVSFLVTGSTSERGCENEEREPAKNTKVVEEAEETEAQRLAPEGNEGKDNETMWAPRARR